VNPYNGIIQQDSFIQPASSKMPLLNFLVRRRLDDANVLDKWAARMKPADLRDGLKGLGTGDNLQPEITLPKRTG
jgi:hypothetical protein